MRRAVGLIGYTRHPISHVLTRMIGRTTGFAQVAFLITESNPRVYEAWLTTRPRSRFTSRAREQRCAIISVRAFAIGVGATNHVVTTVAFRDLSMATAKLFGERGVAVRVHRRFCTFKSAYDDRFLVAKWPRNDKLVALIGPGKIRSKIGAFDEWNDQARDAWGHERNCLSATALLNHDARRCAACIIFSVAAYA